MNNIRLPLILCLSVVAMSASGCARLADKYEIDPITTSVCTPNGANGLNCDASQFGYVSGPDGKVQFQPFDIKNNALLDGCNYLTAVRESDGLCRNRLMDQLVMLSDQRCAAHKAAIEANAAGSNFLFSTATTLLGGAGAIVTGADAARALAGTAGATSGVQANWNESIYQKNVASAIVARIDANRSALLQAMITARSAAPNVYTVDSMLADVYRYHDSCSFYSGLMSLAKADVGPPTSDTLRGRMESLRSQIAANKALRATLTDPQQIKMLEDSNAALLKSLNHLSVQLGVVESRSGSAANAPQAGASDGAPKSE